MTTFKEYVNDSLKEYMSEILKPRLPHLDWVGKEVLALAGVSILIAIGIAFGIILAKYWFLLLWIGIPPLILYGNYCNKRSSEEN